MHTSSAPWADWTCQVANKILIRELLSTKTHPSQHSITNSLSISTRAKIKWKVFNLLFGTEIEVSSKFCCSHTSAACIVACIFDSHVASQTYFMYDVFVSCLQQIFFVLNIFFVLLQTKRVHRMFDGSTENHSGRRYLWFIYASAAILSCKGGTSCRWRRRKVIENWGNFLSDSARQWRHSQILGAGESEDISSRRGTNAFYTDSNDQQNARRTFWIWDLVDESAESRFCESLGNVRAEKRRFHRFCWRNECRLDDSRENHFVDQRARHHRETGDLPTERKAEQQGDHRQTRNAKHSHSE